MVSLFVVLAVSFCVCCLLLFVLWLLCVWTQDMLQMIVEKKTAGKGCGTKAGRGKGGPEK